MTTNFGNDNKTVLVKHDTQRAIAPTKRENRYIVYMDPSVDLC